MKNLLLLVLLTCIQLFAQVETVERLEFDLKDGYYGESIYEFGEKGFLIVANTKAASGEVNWKYDKYNSNLAFEKGLELTLDKDFYKDDSFRDDNNLYTLFKNRKGDYKIIKYSVQTDEFEETNGTIERKAYISRMAVFNNHAYFINKIKF